VTVFPEKLLCNVSGQFVIVISMRRFIRQILKVKVSLQDGPAAGVVHMLVRCSRYKSKNN